MMASVPLNIDTGQQSVSQNQFDLPFPQEARKRIYFHLLLAENAKTPDPTGGPLSYSFRLETLRVNKAVYAEAKQVLFTVNKFVIVSYKATGMGTLLKQAFVPTICEATKKIARLEQLRQHVLRVHYAKPNSRIWAVTRSRAAAVQKSMLIEASKLDVFCRMLRIIAAGLGGPCFNIVSARYQDQPTLLEYLRDGPADQVILKMQCLDTVYLTLSIDLQKQLLEPFRRVVSVGHEVKLLGRVDARLAEDVIFQMRLKATWGLAVGSWLGST